MSEILFGTLIFVILFMLSGVVSSYYASRKRAKHKKKIRNAIKIINELIF